MLAKKLSHYWIFTVTTNHIHNVNDAEDLPNPYVLKWRKVELLSILELETE